MLHVLLYAVCRFRAYHRRRLPAAGAALFVANHQSYLDPILVAVASRRIVHFMARRTLFRGPFGWLIRRYYAYPVERDRADLAAIRDTLDLLRGGRSVLVFPEGTRTRDGRLGPLRGGLGVLARRAGVPLVPVYIDGAFRVWPRQQALPLPATIRVWFGEPIRPPPGEGEREAVRRAEAALRGLEAEARAFATRAKT